MGFDLSSAQPVQDTPAPAAQSSSAFDLSSAKPVLPPRRLMDKDADAPVAPGAQSQPQPSAPGMSLADASASAGQTDSDEANALGRGTGILARGVMRGSGDLEDTPLNVAHMVDSFVVNRLKSWGVVSPDYQLPSTSDVRAVLGQPSGRERNDQTADAMGLPTPANKGERVLSAGAEALPAGAVTGPENIPVALTSAAAGGAASQGVREAGGGPGLQMAAGVGAGLATGGAAGLATGSESITPAAQRLMDEGVPLNAAQATGSKAAAAIDRASQPFSSGAEQFSERQLGDFTRATLKRIGVTDEKALATPDVLAGAKGRIGDVMDNAAAQGLDMSAPVWNKLQAFQANLAKSVEESGQKPILANLNDIRQAVVQNNGTIPGDVLQRIRTNLGTLESSPSAGQAAGELREILDDALPATPALTEARQQYRALKQIEPSVDPRTGLVSPRALLQSMKTKANRNQLLYGQGDQRLTQLAKDASEVLPDKLGNSGTSERFLPLLTLMDALMSNEPVSGLAKTFGTIAGTVGTARVLRNQTVVKATAGRAAGAAGGAGTGAAAGFRGSALQPSQPPALDGSNPAQ